MRVPIYKNREVFTFQEQIPFVTQVEVRDKGLLSRSAAGEGMILLIYGFFWALLDFSVTDLLKQIYVGRG